MFTCTCGCCLEIDHPGQAYCPYCRVVLHWVDGDGWTVIPDDDESDLEDNEY